MVMTLLLLFVQAVAPSAPVAIAGARTPVPVTREETARAEVSCEIVAVSPARRYRLHRRSTGMDDQWVLSLRRAGSDGEVAIALPTARPTFTGDRAHLSYRSSNGGVIVELEAAPDRSLLDVYVSYELEVNVDADLSPRVDELNTGGPRRDAQCKVAGP